VTNIKNNNPHVVDGLTKKDWYFYIYGIRESTHPIRNGT